MDVRLKDVWEHVDRHGNMRIYVKVPGRKKVRIGSNQALRNSWQSTTRRSKVRRQRRFQSSTDAAPSDLLAKPS